VAVGLRGGPEHNAPVQKKDHRTRVAAQRRDRMRRCLFVSTAQLVAVNGMATTSIDDAIQAAEVSRGTFYKYFDSPDTPFTQLALGIGNDIIRMAEPAVLQLKDPAERVATGMRLVIQVGASNCEIASFLVRRGWPETRAGGVLLDFVQHDLQEGLRLCRFVKMPMNLVLNITSMTVLGSMHAMLAPGAQQRDFPEQAVASALRALGIDTQESERIATMELSAPAVSKVGCWDHIPLCG
jgi:AcrR family transcriptional regulator